MSANYIIDEKVDGNTYGLYDIMYKDFERCTFTNCDFTACDFLGVAFTDCVFHSCNFSAARINYVGLRNAVFNHCDFSDVNFVMVDSLLFNAEFKDCILDYTKFYTFKLKGTLFSNCSIVAADFMKTDLTGVVFDNCNLHKSVFTDAVANGADFTTSYNFSIDPDKTKLKKAKFSQAGLKGLLDKYEIIVK
jgi:uncharacterized protein YjbI with pentapeptide repeats